MTSPCHYAIIYQIDVEFNRKQKNRKAGSQMIVRVEQEGGEHISLYEGNHIGVHRRKAVENEEVNIKEGLTLVVSFYRQSGQECLTLELDKDDNTRIFIMNDQGKTIDRRFI